MKLKKDLLYYAHLEVYVKEVHDLVCNALNLKPISLEIRELKPNESVNLKGHFSSQYRRITIIDDNITTYFDLANVIAHETRHYWQYVNNTVNFSDYTSHEDDIEKYYNHTSEIDAREYAYEFIMEFQNEIYELSQKHVNREFELSKQKEEEIKLEEINWFEEDYLSNEPIWG